MSYHHFVLARSPSHVPCAALCAKLSLGKPANQLKEARICQPRISGQRDRSRSLRNSAATAAPSAAESEPLQKLRQFGKSPFDAEDRHARPRRGRLLQKNRGCLSMLRYSFHPGPLEDLTGEEVRALEQVASGLGVSAVMYQKLELGNLIKEGLGGWTLTEEGSYRLAQGK